MQKNCTVSPVFLCTKILVKVLTNLGRSVILHLTIRLNVKWGEKLGLQSTLKALSDPIRREILEMLKEKRLSAGEITEHFDVTAASISRHLSVLKEADLIRDERQGKYIFYELNTSVLEEIMLWLTALKGD